MKILLTGITGFLGRHLAKRLIKNGHRVYAIIRKPGVKNKLKLDRIGCFVDTGSDEKLLKFFQEHRFNGVIHLASRFIIEHKMEDIRDLVNSNILFAARILESSVKSHVSWFINTGTCWQHYQNKKYSPVNLYAASKQAFEVIAQYYIETFDINFVTLKLNDTYGPQDTRPKIFNIWNNISNTDELLLMSPGEQLIDLTYIDDVVDAYIMTVALLKKDTSRLFRGKEFAVLSGNPLPLKELAKVFSKITGKKLNIKWGGKSYRKREVMVPWNKAEKVPGWKPKVALEEGIFRTFNGDNEK